MKGSNRNGYEATQNALFFIVYLKCHSDKIQYRFFFPPDKKPLVPWVMQTQLLISLAFMHPLLLLHYFPAIRP